MPGMLSLHLSAFYCTITFKTVLHLSVSPSNSRNRDLNLFQYSVLNILCLSSTCIHAVDFFELGWKAYN